MAKQNHKTDSFKEFLSEYKAVQLPKRETPINTSKYTLPQQLKRFNNFSHSESESEVMDKEVSAL